MKEIVYVALGGSLGSVGRYLVGLAFTQQTTGSFPIATLSVNLIGSLLIGILSSFFTKGNNEAVSFILITGFCGGFTTFSTFSLDGLKLIQRAEYTSFFTYTGLSVLGGLILCGLGFWLANKIIH